MSTQSHSLSLMPTRQQTLAVMNAHILGKKGEKKNTTSSNASPCRPCSQLANAQGGIIAVCWKEVHAQRTQQSKRKSRAYTHALA